MSSSTDSSVILWSQPNGYKSGTLDTFSNDDLWIAQQRFGDVGGQRLGGFVGGFWADNQLGAYGWNGSWRRWLNDGHKWVEISGLTGHQGPVKGLSWSENGEYLLSTRCVHDPKDDSKTD
jgi:elongator complex protein 2